MFSEKAYNSLDKKKLKEYNKIRNKSRRSRFCQAPFSTLFFSEYGEILPCYYNKSIVFGNSDTSFEEAWFSPQMEKLREHIIHNDLSFGCQDCKFYFDLENYYSVGAWKYDYLPVNKSRYPVSLDFQISNICNLSCIMCNGELSQTVRKNREKKEVFKNPYDNSIIKKITPFLPHLKEAAFTGGEVFLIKLYYDIWDKIIEVNPSIRVSITTNGTILNSRVKSYLEKLDFNITISIDSVNKENFEKIRRFSDFETVIKNLDYYKDYTQRKGTNFTVKICPMRQNWHEIPEIINFLNNKNISFLFNNVIFPPYTSLWNLPSIELKEIADFIDKPDYKGQSATNKTNIKRVKNLVSQLKNWQKASLEIETNYPDLKNKTSKELYELIITSVNNFKNSFPDISNKDEYGFEIEKIFDAIFDKITDEETLRNALIFYFKMPVHRLISEFNIRNTDKIIDRTMQSGLTEPAPI
ncbi:MAG: radical SAM protein [Bacteroidota bacterium]